MDSERDLARIHQVSLMTARHALTSLEREGIVEVARRGNVCGTAQDPLHKLMSYTEQMASRGLVAVLSTPERQMHRPRAGDCRPFRPAAQQFPG